MTRVHMLAIVSLSRLWENSVYTQYTVGILHHGADVNIASGCSKRPSSKAAASEEARRTLRYVEPLSDARTPLADFFSTLLVLRCAAGRGIGRWGSVGGGAFPHQRREFGELVHPLI